jgi:hypothetical protein
MSSGDPGGSSRDDGVTPLLPPPDVPPARRKSAGSRGLGLTRAQTQAQFRQRQKVWHTGSGLSHVMPGVRVRIVVLPSCLTCVFPLSSPRVRPARVAAYPLPSEAEVIQLLLPDTAYSSWLRCLLPLRTASAAGTHCGAVIPQQVKFGPPPLSRYPGLSIGLTFQLVAHERAASFDLRVAVSTGQARCAGKTGGRPQPPPRATAA